MLPFHNASVQNQAAPGFRSGFAPFSGEKPDNESHHPNIPWSSQLDSALPASASFA
jgi:hypothetical protein